MHKEQSTRAHCASRSMPESFVIRRPARSLSRIPASRRQNFWKILFYFLNSQSAPGTRSVTLHYIVRANRFPPFFIAISWIIYRHYFYVMSPAYLLTLEPIVFRSIYHPYRVKKRNFHFEEKFLSFFVLLPMHRPQNVETIVYSNRIRFITCG